MADERQCPDFFTEPENIASCFELENDDAPNAPQSGNHEISLGTSNKISFVLTYVFSDETAPHQSAGGFVVNDAPNAPQSGNYEISLDITKFPVC